MVPSLTWTTLSVGVFTLCKLKNKEPARKNIVPKKNDKIAHVKIGPENINDWLNWVDNIVSRAKKESSSAEEFLVACKSLGLVVTYPYTFLRVYWRSNIKKEFVDSIVEGVGVVSP